MTEKQDAIRLIERLPEDASIDDIMYELYIKERIDLGLQQAAEGKTLSHEEVKKALAEWLRSAGR